MRKTKIVCTLGPAVDDEKILEQLIISGMDVARLNFSHGTHEDHLKRINRFKKLRDKHNKPIPLLLDTKGPEIRTGLFKNNSVELIEAQDFIICHEDIEGDNSKCSISYKDLHNDINVGNKILINDGLIELEVKKIVDKDVHCTVVNGGVIGNNKGMNLQETDINLPSLTDKDIQDILFGIENDFDIIAASFVRKASDVIEIKKILEKNKSGNINVIAKIENRQGVRNIDEILKVADGVMVARGDLGVEIPPEEVPVVQKSIIKKCYHSGKPVITATQMLDSMIRNPRPTRAEASDVANAIYDGTSAIMLSGETAAGKYPIESLKTMSKIAEKAENSINYWELFKSREFNVCYSVTNAISHSTCATAYELNAAAIITVTHSGHTARMISRFRPAAPIIATTVYPKVCRQLSLNWGVTPYLVETVDTTDEMFDIGVQKALDSKKVNNGDIVIITAGVPAGVSGTTNIMKVHVVGKVLVQGTGTNSGITTGEICVVRTVEEAAERFQENSILVVPSTDNNMLPYIKRASALVVEEQGLTSHAAISAMALEIPFIIGAENAIKILKTGSVVTVDGNKGLIYYGTAKI